MNLTGLAAEAHIVVRDGNSREFTERPRGGRRAWPGDQNRAGVPNRRTPPFPPVKLTSAIAAPSSMHPAPRLIVLAAMRTNGSQACRPRSATRACPHNGCRPTPTSQQQPSDHLRRRQADA
jgi:hypothetical protein